MQQKSYPTTLTLTVSDLLAHPNPNPNPNDNDIRARRRLCQTSHETLTLTLTLAELGAVGVGYVMHGIDKRGIASLVYLNLSGCSINNHERGESVALQALSSAGMSGTLKLLVSLCLQNNGLKDTDGVGIVKMLPRMRRLQTLNLADNMIRNATTSALCVAAFVGDLPSLTNLELRNNNITWFGAKDLNRALHEDRMPGLLFLTIAWNNINPNDMARLYATQDKLFLRGHVLNIDNNLDMYDSDGVSDES
jgi:Ran GTPase-activating protein (RanGAP) involved in mRNA processing and transport